MKVARCAVLAALAMLVAAVGSAQGEDPVIDGSRLSDWARQLGSTDPHARVEAGWKILFLTEQGGSLDSAAESLVEALQDEVSDVRVIAACALARAQPGRRRELLPLLVDGLESTDNVWLQENAAAVLALYGPDAEPAVEQLIDGLDVFPASSVPDVGEDISRASERVRTSCCTALGLIGAAAESALPALRLRLADPSPAVRIAAAEAMVRLDPATAVETLSVLGEVARDASDEGLRQQAEAAMHRVLVAPAAPSGNGAEAELPRELVAAGEPATAAEPDEQPAEPPAPAAETASPGGSIPPRRAEHHLPGLVESLRTLVAAAHEAVVGDAVAPAVGATSLAAYEVWRDAFADGHAAAGAAAEHSRVLAATREQVLRLLRDGAELVAESTAARRALTEAVGFFERELTSLRRLVRVCERASQRGTFRPAELQEAASLLRVALAAERLAVGRVEKALGELEAARVAEETADR